MKPTKETQGHYFAALLEGASARMNINASNYHAAAKYADRARQSWAQVKWERPQ